MIFRNTLLIIVGVLVCLNIAILAYMYINLEAAKTRISDLEANAEEALSLIYPQGINTDIYTSLTEIEKRLKRNEELLDSLYPK